MQRELNVTIEYNLFIGDIIRYMDSSVVGIILVAFTEIVVVIRHAVMSANPSMSRQRILQMFLLFYVIVLGTW